MCIHKSTAMLIHLSTHVSMHRSVHVFTHVRPPDFIHGGIYMCRHVSSTCLLHICIWHAFGPVSSHVYTHVHPHVCVHAFAPGPLSCLWPHVCPQWTGGPPPPVQIASAPESRSISPPRRPVHNTLVCATCLVYGPVSTPMYGRVYGRVYRPVGKRA